MATGPDIAAAAVADAIKHISLHSANPGESGASELTGSGYARQPVTWGTSSGGAVAATNLPLLFSGAASASSPFFGGWTAATGGTFVDGGALQGDVSLNAEGDYEITSLSVVVTRAS